MTHGPPSAHSGLYIKSNFAGTSGSGFNNFVDFGRGTIADGFAPGLQAVGGS